MAVGQKLRLFTGLLNEFHQITCENFVVAYPMKKILNQPLPTTCELCGERKRKLHPSSPSTKHGTDLTVQITVGVVMGSFAVPARYVAQCMSFMLAGWARTAKVWAGKASAVWPGFCTSAYPESCAKGFSQGTQKVFWTY